MKTKLYILLWMCCSVLLVACGEDDPIIEVTEVTLNKSVLSLDEGESETLIAIITPDDATNKKVIWLSSDSSVVTVNSAGKVTALKAGSATIIITTEDGAKIATCAITVTSSQVVTRTVLIYLAADNSLSSMVADDLKEMKEGIAKLDNSNIHLLVYIDTGSSPRLIELKKKNGEVAEIVIKNYEKRNSVGTVETMEVFNEVFSNNDFRAENYGLIYWSHGDGWVPNPLPSSRWVGQDTGNGTHYMNIADLVTILQSAPHFDFILFDACFMQSIEVAYAVRNYTDYYIGSPTEIPGPGARYDILVPAMFAEGDVALKTATAYFTPYKEKYNGGKGLSNSNWTGGVSVSLLKTSEMEHLANITKQVLSGIANNADLRSKAYDYDKRPSYFGHVGYYDMVEMMRLLTDNADFTAWKQVYDAVMPYWATTPMNYSAFAEMFSMEDTNGLSHYIPSSNSGATAAYRSTDWYKDVDLSKIGW